MPQRVRSGKPELKSAQRRALLALESEPGASLTRSEYERLTGVGRSQAAYDLSELVSAGVVVRVGGGPTTRYVLAHEPDSKRHWTPDRIRRELGTFCAGRSAWPTASEFKAAGRGDLYVAASRYGGVARWADELGLVRVDRSRTAATAGRTSLRSRLAWGLAGGLVASTLAAAALVAVFATHQFGPTTRAGANSSPSAEPSSRIVQAWIRTPRPVSTPAAAHPSHPVARTHIRRPHADLSRARSTTTQRAFVSQPVQTAPAHTESTTSVTPAAVASHSGGPAPLPAPTGGSGPSPLGAPSR